MRPNSRVRLRLSRGDALSDVGRLLDLGSSVFEDLASSRVRPRTLNPQPGCRRSLAGPRSMDCEEKMPNRYRSGGAGNVDDGANIPPAFALAMWNPFLAGALEGH